MKNMMKKLTVIAALAGASALPAQAGTQYTGESGAVCVDQTTGTHIAAATDTSAYVPTKIGTPTMLLGVVAQRYPWNGMLDVQYKTQYVTVGTPITVTVTLPDGKTASETYACQNGQNTVAFDARAAFGEVKVKGAKVKLSLAE